MTKLTHKGWFWFCPIYLSPAEPDAPVEARRAWLEPLFSLCMGLEAARIFATSIIVPDYEPTFMFRVTGEVKPGGNSTDQTK
ncbi:MAG: hypothetical protein ABI843_09685 [Dokdonella sp.]